MNNKTNPVQGSNIEHLFANSIFHHETAWLSILSSLGLEGYETIHSSANVVGARKRKADFSVKVENQNEIQDVRVSIKSFKGSGYNQVERRNLSRFCERHQILKRDYEFLKGLWIRRALNESKGLVESQDQDRIKHIFSDVEPGISALCGHDIPQIFALYNMDLSKWHLYDMIKQVYPHVKNSNMTFTKKGGNIEIGNYIVIQRKGSKKESKRDIGDINHGANDVQVKMRVGKFFKEICPVSWYQF